MFRKSKDKYLENKRKIRSKALRQCKEEEKKGKKSGDSFLNINKALEWGKEKVKERERESLVREKIQFSIALMFGPGAKYYTHTHTEPFGVAQY